MSGSRRQGLGKLGNCSGIAILDAHVRPLEKFEGVFDAELIQFFGKGLGSEVEVPLVRLASVEIDATYLGEHGLVPGRLLTEKEARTLDGVITVEAEDGTTHSLGAPLASALFVRSPSGDG